MTQYDTGAMCRLELTMIVILMWLGCRATPCSQMKPR